jgi:hypothetical protein
VVGVARLQQVPYRQRPVGFSPLKIAVLGLSLGILDPRIGVLDLLPSYDTSSVLTMSAPQGSG